MTRFKDTPIYKVAERVVALKNKDSEMFSLILDNKFIRDLIVFLNTDEQLGKEHVDSLGNALFNQFSDSTTYSLFDKKGRGGKPYELFDTGDYWDSFTVEFGNFTIFIKSNPFKDGDNIFDMFGNDVEGLTPSNLQILINEALKLYVRWFEKNILA